MIISLTANQSFAAILRAHYLELRTISVKVLLHVLVLKLSIAILAFLFSSWTLLDVPSHISSHSIFSTAEGAGQEHKLTVIRVITELSHLPLPFTSRLVLVTLDFETHHMTLDRVVGENLSRLQFSSANRARERIFLFSEGLKTSATETMAADCLLRIS